MRSKLFQNKSKFNQNKQNVRERQQGYGFIFSNRTKTSANAPLISIGEFEEKAHSNKQNFQQSPRSTFNGSYSRN